MPIATRQLRDQMYPCTLWRLPCLRSTLFGTRKEAERNSRGLGTPCAGRCTPPAPRDWSRRSAAFTFLRMALAHVIHSLVQGARFRPTYRALQLRQGGVYMPRGPPVFCFGFLVKLLLSSHFSRRVPWHQRTLVRYHRRLHISSWPRPTVPPRLLHCVPRKT